MSLATFAFHLKANGHLRFYIKRHNYLFACAALLLLALNLVSAQAGMLPIVFFASVWTLNLSPPCYLAFGIHLA
jgi:hypothetical protein